MTGQHELVGRDGTVVDQSELRRTLATFATGVAVVTVGSTPHGMTANSFTSVSLDPPLVLICVEHGAVMHATLSRSRQFAVSILAAGQEAVARHFADRRRPLGSAQFATVDWFAGPLTGAPLIAGAAAHFECQLWRSYPGGDHTIFVGRLLALDSDPAAGALLFLHGRMRRLDPNEVH